MTPQLLAQKEKELREKYPAMFSHPELRAGEVQIEDALYELSGHRRQTLKNIGFQSARFGSSHVEKVAILIVNNDSSLTPTSTNLSFFPIFVSLEEYFKVVEAHEPQPKPKQ